MAGVMIPAWRGQTGGAREHSEKGNSQKKKTMPNAMFASAHHGVARGEPMYAICAQSKVMRDMPLMHALG